MSDIKKGVMGTFKNSAIIAIILTVIGVAALVLTAFGVAGLGGAKVNTTVAVYDLRIGQENPAPVTDEDVLVIENFLPEVFGEVKTSVRKFNDTCVEITADVVLMEAPAAAAALFTEMGNAFGMDNMQRVSLKTESMAAKGADLLTAELAWCILVLLVFAYMWIRFDLRASLAALVAGILSMGMVLVYYTLIGLPLNSSLIMIEAIAYLCATLDTIIVFASIKERAKAVRNEEFGTTVEHGVRRVKGTVLKAMISVGVALVAVLMVCTSGYNLVSAAAVSAGFGAFAAIKLAAPLWAKFRKKAASR